MPTHHLPPRVRSFDIARALGPSLSPAHASQCWIQCHHHHQRTARVPLRPSVLAPSSSTAAAKTYLANSLVRAIRAAPQWVRWSPAAATGPSRRRNFAILPCSRARELASCRSGSFAGRPFQYIVSGRCWHSIAWLDSARAPTWRLAAVGVLGFGDNLNRRASRPGPGAVGGTANKASRVDAGARVCSVHARSFWKPPNFEGTAGRHEVWH